MDSTGPVKLDAYQRATPSPDGRFLVRTTASEAAMSHWLEFAQLLDAHTGHVVADVGTSSWSADAIRWAPDGAHVELELRRYPGDGPGLAVRVFPAAQRAELVTTEGVEAVPLEALTPAMERFYERHRRPPRPRAPRR
jgi:hypothetical protein